MTKHPLLSRFDLITDTPGNIQRLRKLIVHLAISGYLADNMSDEPSPRAILERIASKKKALIKLGKIKKQRIIPAVDETELPVGCSGADGFDRLENIAMLEKGLTAIQRAKPGKYPLVTTGEGRSTASHHDFDGCAAIIPMVSSTGHGNASLKRLHYQEGKFALGNILCAAFPIDEELMSARFIFEYLTAFKEELLVSKMIGTANVSLTLGKIGEVPIPIVPPSVQRRVEELMTLCDRFEEALERRENARNKLVTASLNGLNSSENEESFQEYSQFCVSHFARLATRSDHIQALRQTVFNLAVRGLLVRHDPKDESAARLLGERRLIPNSEPWKLPSGWAWSSFNLIGETLGGGTPSKAQAEFWKGAIPWVSPKDMKVDVITDSQDHISTAAVEQSAVRLIPTGSLLMVVRGMILAHSFPTASTEVPVTINQDVKAVVPFRADMIRFLVLLTKGLKPEVLRLVLRSTHGTCKLLTDDLFSLPIPIPPLVEQGRILAKVNELLALCDRLEATLSSKREDAARLLEALLHSSLPTAGTPRDGLDGFEISALRCTS